MIEEHFTASWTGQMKTYVLNDGRKLNFATMMRIEKGRSYVVRYDETLKMGRLIPMVMP